MHARMEMLKLMKFHQSLTFDRMSLREGYHESSVFDENAHWAMKLP